MNEVNFDIYNSLFSKTYVKHFGQVTKVIGLTIESLGPDAKLGELCAIWENKDSSVLSEVVGFKEDKILLMPLGEIGGIGRGAKVEALGHSLRVPVSDNLIGRVVDGLGKPIDSKSAIYSNEFYDVECEAPDPLNRNRIKDVLPIGVKAIDSQLTIGRGQRVGIFAGSGVGKSTLMGMIARNALSDINVIALIGERGREIREFIEKDLGEEGLKRSVIVVATSDKPALIRQKAAKTATAIAEYFRDKGKDVMLMMDSLTRFSMAQREVGLAIGEPPVSRGYTPSVFAILPKLLERAGNSDKGSITALYTVLVDGDDMNEPITDAARGILDGHIVLSRKLANKNHYPAIDILASVSRVMGDVASKEHVGYARKLKSILATYTDAEDLINIGAYVKGSNKKIDEAIEKIDDINDFLTQFTEENVQFSSVVETLGNIIS